MTPEYKEPVALDPTAISRRTAVTPERDDEHVCPICLEAFEPTDLCADDVELGICHAECLEGSPVVDLETGAPVDGEVSTYRYEEVSKP